LTFGDDDLEVDGNNLSAPSRAPSIVTITPLV
jgi:hypothetical protein